MAVAVAPTDPAYSLRVSGRGLAVSSDSESHRFGRSAGESRPPESEHESESPPAGAAAAAAAGRRARVQVRFTGNLKRPVTVTVAAMRVSHDR